VRCRAPAGSVHQLTFAELARQSGHIGSSHELGVVAAVELALKLGRAPARGGLLGIAIARVQRDARYSLSPAVSRALNEVLKRLRRWVEELNENRSCSLRH
jgi:hydrogenase maturation protease